MYPDYKNIERKELERDKIMQIGFVLAGCFLLVGIILAIDLLYYLTHFKPCL